MHKYRTHNCGQICNKNISETVKLSGWVHRIRDHGNLLFVDLRDHYGITQCVVEKSSEVFVDFKGLKAEDVITVTGTVVKRDSSTINDTIATGKIEIFVTSLEVLSHADLLPMTINNDAEYPEEIRLKYRFLDLRRARLHSNIILRSKVISYLRFKMQEMGFLEYQTPILTASSPEGARDYLVPSRLHRGKFYALPQAPQQFKQLLMVAGFDKYFQIAPCFRDEDSRADRSPGEFYQLDIEMSFVTQEDVFAILEPVLYGVFKEFSNKHISSYPFPRISFDEALFKYGSDKPDLRNPLLICDVTEVFKNSAFSIFANGIQEGKVVRGIYVPDIADKPRSFFDKMNDFAHDQEMAGLGYLILDQMGPKGPIAKFLDNSRIELLKEISGLKDGGCIFFICDYVKLAAKNAGFVRNKLGQELKLISQDTFEFCWIIDFPMYELNDDGVIEFSHNPFSMPQGGLEALLNEDPLKIKAFQYDIVCNGVELSSGAIRNSSPEIMYKAFEIAGYSKEFVDDKFGGMIRAFKFGAPPHGGAAPGVDRIIMLLAEEPNIREVIAFPLNQKAEDLMMNAPCPVTEKQIKELNIKIVQEEKKQ